MPTKKERKQLDVRIIKDSLVWQYMPSPETVVRNTPRGLLIYDDMRQDARIGSLFEDRRNSTHNLPASLSPSEDAAIQEYTERHLTIAKLRKWGFYLLDGALTYGFRPAEIIWQKDEKGYYYIEGLDGHDIMHYRFDSDGRLWYGPARLLDEECKWIIHRNEGDRYNRPYGRAYLSRIYWPWRFKKMGWEFWMNAAEKFAVPSLVVLFDQSDPEKARTKAEELADLISQMTSGSGGAFANIKGIQQISMGGSVSDYAALITACDLQIAYGMTGQALATNVSDTGTQALGTVQERTKNAAYENDARALAYTLQKLVDMAVEVNFGTSGKAPRFSFDTEDFASFDEVMRAHQAGIPISRRAMYSRYGLPEPEDDEDILDQPLSGGYPGGIGTAFNFADDGKKKVLPMIVMRSSARR